MIVLLVGLPGSGKTTLARALQPQLQAYLLNRDAIRDAIFPDDTLDYSHEQNAIATRTMLNVARYILSKDPTRILILDGKPFVRRSEIEEVARIAQDTGSELRIIHCTAPDHVIATRLQHDQERDPRNQHADRSFAKAQRLKELFDPVTMPHLTVDTTLDLPILVEQCLRFITNPTVNP